MSEDISRFNKIDRSRDVYKIHDSSKKRRKERKGEDEQEFLKMLEDSEHEPEEQFNNKKQENKQSNIPTRGMLNNLNSISPPPMIEPISEEDEPGGTK